MPTTTKEGNKFSYSEDYFQRIYGIRHAIFLPIQSIIILVSFFSRRSSTRVIDYRCDNIFLHGLLSIILSKSDKKKLKQQNFSFLQWRSIPREM